MPLTKIAIDAMGGDNAPQSVIAGTIEALRERKDISILLTGNKDIITEELQRMDGLSMPIEIIHTEESVSMHDSPTQAFKSKPNSSMSLAIKLQKEGKADASLSAGNTGALLVSSMFILGRLEGVQRAAIGIIVPAVNGPLIFLDGGANADCKPQHLLQFAIMGNAYAQCILDIVEPRIGLLSIGEESSKGNEITLETHPLLAKSKLNFIGNVESSKVILGGVDVIVCDGFVGNIVLKLIETIPHLLKMFMDKPNAAMSKWDATQYGGAPFLGLNGISIKAHGGSSAQTIKNAIFAAQKVVNQDINKKIQEYIKETV